MSNSHASQPTSGPCVSVFKGYQVITHYFIFIKESLLKSK